jgi:phosphomannomutase / phosphoglucomutase
MAESETQTVRSTLFGTNGIRGVVGGLYTPSFVSDIACAYGTWLAPPGAVLVGQDFRTTSVGIARILAGSLQMLGFDVVEMGSMPTPCFQFNLRETGAKGGLMVTASHNPPEFNGIKFAGPRGRPIPPEAEEKIDQHFTSRTFLRPDWMTAGTIRRESSGVDRYLSSIRRNVDTEAIVRRCPSVVLDPGHGASAVTSPRLLRELGCTLLTLNSTPDGWFPGRLSDPSEENLARLASAVPDTGAAVGIAHDGDADRAAFVDERGRFVPGDAALALFVRYVLRRRPGATIVTTITTSTAVEDEVQRHGGTLLVTRTGTPWMAAEIERSGAAFGGDDWGHCFWPEHQNAPDGPMTSAVMLEILSREGRPLSELLAEIPTYVVRRRSVPLDPRQRGPVLEHVFRALSERAERVDTTDGVKAYLPGGWVLIRPSGTEPLMRVYAEGKSAERADAFAEAGLGIVREAMASAPSAARRSRP